MRKRRRSGDEAGTRSLGDIFPFGAKVSNHDRRGCNDARATTSNGLANSAVDPQTCHRLIMIRVYVKTPIQLYII
jgi:hypothetical protein